MQQMSRGMGILVALTFAACGDPVGGPSGLIQCEDDDFYDYVEPLTYVEGCGLTFDQCNPCPPDSACVQGLAVGATSEGYTDELGTCSVPCETDVDCRDLSYERVNGSQTDSEVWVCDGDVCRGRLDYDPGSVSPCERCRNTCAGQGSWCTCEAEC